jgi:hypothetical protein
MTDYSTYRRCQWIVEYRQLSLWDETERPTPARRLCSNRARFKIGDWTWLCAQHANMSKNFGPSLLVTKITSVQGRPDGQL